MAHTNETTNYELSQFTGTDRPSWLDDYNADMTKIDAAINAATQSGTNTYTKTEADGRFAPKSYTAPSTTGLTAAEYNRLYVDANGIVRCKPASN